MGMNLAVKTFYREILLSILAVLLGFFLVLVTMDGLEEMKNLGEHDYTWRTLISVALAGLCVSFAADLYFDRRGIGAVKHGCALGVDRVACLGSERQTHGWHHHEYGRGVGGGGDFGR